MAQLTDVLAVDNGTGFVKAGYAGDNIPKFTFPSMVGRPTLRAEEDVIGDVDLKPIMVGEQAAAVRQALEISYPLENGIIRSWEDMEHVWRYLFDDKMQINPKEKKILLTEAPMNPTTNRKKMLEVMMEKFGFGGFQCNVQAVLALYAQGLTSGMVVDSGDGVTHIECVHDTYHLTHLTRRLDVAGRHITNHLIKLLLHRGYAFNRTSDMQTAAELKEKLCYVALEPEKEKILAEETTALTEKYTLPDGRVIQIGPERYQAPEALFRPGLIDVEAKGISELVFDVIQKADIDIRPTLYGNIVLSGGTTMYPGFSSRLEHDLKNMYVRDILKGDAKRMKMKIAVEDPPGRKHLVFQGAAAIAKMTMNSSGYWVTQQDYKEEGVDRLVARLNKFGGQHK